MSEYQAKAVADILNALTNQAWTVDCRGSGPEDYAIKGEYIFETDSLHVALAYAAAAARERKGQ